MWPIVDDLTAEHGIVTWLVVPGYRERTDATVHGDLHLAQRSIPTALSGNRDRRPVPAKLHAVGDEAGWVDRFAAQVDAFAREHGRHEPLVRVTLADGDQFFLASLEERPGDGFVTLRPHPER